MIVRACLSGATVSRGPFTRKFPNGLLGIDIWGILRRDAYQCGDPFKEMP